MNRGLGTQLRHLIELLDGDVAQAYVEAGLDYLPRYTPVMRVLAAQQAATIGQIAQAAGITQPAATQTVARMKEVGLITRTRLYRFERTRMITSSTAAPTVTPRPWYQRFLGFALTRIVLGLVALALSAGVVSNVIRALVPKDVRMGWPSLVTAAVVLLVYIGWVRLTERRPVAELARPGAVREALAGLVGGFALVALVVALAAMAGVYYVAAAPGWSLLLLVPLAQMAFAGVIEETMFRGLVFRITEGALGTWPAVAISSVLFGLAHLSAGTGLLVVAGASVAGVLFAATYLLTRRLWLSIGVHAGWNYALGTIFSVPVSGQERGPALLVGRLTGPEWLSGGAYGLEASVLALAVVGVAATSLLWLAKRRNGGTLANRAHSG
ncbi:MAG: CPBP family intramembrane metalloprotease [Massilia sp.]|nr:CPBP family intramembrane metalloprotease [Massilia sp.]